MRWVAGVAVILVALAPAGPALGQDEAELQRLFATFLQTKDLRIDAVPDLYPGGFARISIYARKANLGGMWVDEVWLRVIGATLDLRALRQGTFRLAEYRDSAIYARFTLKSLQDYFLAGNEFKDIRLWSDGEYLFGEGTVPLNSVPVKVWLKGFFVVGGTKDVYFYIDNMRVNGIPMLSPLIRIMETKYNPVLTQSTWPVTFVIRSLKLTRDVFVVSSQQDPNSPCAFCTGGDAPIVTP